MKFSLRVLTVFLIVITGSYSQGFQKDLIWIGPTLGYGFGSIGFGAQGEYGIDNNIGFGVDIGYSGFTEDFGGFSDAEFKYTLLGILVAGSYHFSPNKQFDPYIKAGIGYFNWDFSYYVDGKEIDMPYGTSAAYSSGVGFTGQIGMRYHMNEKWALRASLGYPFILGAGFDFAFGETKGNKKTKIKKEVVEPEYIEDEETEPATETNEAETDEIPASKSSKKPKKDAYSIYIGPYLGAKTTINTVFPEGRINGLGFSAPDIGIATYLPFAKNSKIGLLLELGYAPYSFSSKPFVNETDANSITESYSYINISPSLYLGGFIIGINFGFAQSADAKNGDGEKFSVLDGRGFDNWFELDDPDAVNYLANLTEIKLGGCIPLVSDENGRLNLNITGSYVLSGLFENAEIYKFSYEENANGSVESKSDLNPKPVSLNIGLSYLFNVGL